MARDEQNGGAMPAAADSSRERGLALLVVLWIIVSATLLVTSFNATVRSGATFVASEVQLAKTEAALDAGAEIAAAHLIDTVKARRWTGDGCAAAASTVPARAASRGRVPGLPRHARCAWPGHDPDAAGL